MHNVYFIKYIYFMSQMQVGNNFLYIFNFFKIVFSFQELILKFAQSSQMERKLNCKYGKLYKSKLNKHKTKKNRYKIK